jgi:hypothetical protein
LKIEIRKKGNETPPLSFLALSLGSAALGGL